MTQSSSSSKPPAPTPVSRGHEGRGHVILRASVPVLRVLHRPPPTLEQPRPGDSVVTNYLNNFFSKEIFSKEDVDGGLIGGASLKATDFTGIISAF